MLKQAIAAALVLAATQAAQAGPAIAYLSDDASDGSVRRSISDVRSNRHGRGELELVEPQLELVRWQTEWKALEQRILHLPPETFATLLGAGTEARPDGFAFPVFERGAVSLLQSALTQRKGTSFKQLIGPSRFHYVEGIAGVQVFYQHDYRTPRHVLLYFLMDSEFVALKDREQLPARLAYDTARLRTFSDWFDRNTSATHKAADQSGVIAPVP